MDSVALHDCLRRLIPHVDIARIALTGGVAIGIHLDGTRDGQARSATAEDIDFVAAEVDAVCHTVTNDFLVSHFHLPQASYPKFLIQLVDPVTRLRLDFFPDTTLALTQAAVLDVAGIPLRVLAACDILDHKMRLLCNASAAHPVEQKHCADAERLGAICERQVAPMEAVRLATTVYSQDVDGTCLRCEGSRHGAFPLAPKRAIRDVLGYV